MKHHIDRNVDRVDYREMDGPSDKEIRDEIIEELKKYTCSESEAEDMYEWMEVYNWENYDCIERWIHTPTRKVVSTKTLYKIYARVHQD